MPDQPSAKPTQKVTAAMVAGAIVTLLAWCLSFADVELPAEVGAAVTALIMAVAAYAVPEA